MVKETMQAVNDAEQAARQTVLHAKEESELLLKDAASKGEQLKNDALKEARKKAEVLYGVARADGEKSKTAAVQETEREQERLRAHAQTCRSQVAERIVKIVLGQS